MKVLDEDMIKMKTFRLYGLNICKYVFIFNLLLAIVI